jgi:histone H3/H4
MDQYARTLARVAAAQLCEVAGFEAVQESAIDILADLLCRYQQATCVSAHQLAELAGRTQANAADILLALEDFNISADDLNTDLRMKVGAQSIASETFKAILYQRQGPD